MKLEGNCMDDGLVWKETQHCVGASYADEIPVCKVAFAGVV